MKRLVFENQEIYQVIIRNSDSNCSVMPNIESYLKISDILINSRLLADFSSKIFPFKVQFTKSTAQLRAIYGTGRYRKLNFAFCISEYFLKIF